MANTYPLDTSGALPGNKVIETIVQAVNTDPLNYDFVIPTYAPFFSDTVKVELLNNSNSVVRTLAVDRDYVFSHRFLVASQRTGKGVYSSITFRNRDQARIRLTYQTLGGIWNRTQAIINNEVATLIRSPLTRTWEDVVGVTDYTVFPSTAHTVDVTDLRTMDDVINALNAIALAIGEAPPISTLNSYVEAATLRLTPKTESDPDGLYKG